MNTSLPTNIEVRYSSIDNLIVAEIVNDSHIENIPAYELKITVNKSLPLYDSISAKIKEIDTPILPINGLCSCDILLTELLHFIGDINLTWNIPFRKDFGVYHNETNLPTLLESESMEYSQDELILILNVITRIKPMYSMNPIDNGIGHAITVMNIGLESLRPIGTINYDRTRREVILASLLHDAYLYTGDATHNVRLVGELMEGGSSLNKWFESMCETYDIDGMNVLFAIMECKSFSKEKHSCLASSILISADKEACRIACTSCVVAE